MIGEKSLLSPPPAKGTITLLAQNGSLIVMHHGKMGKDTIAEWIISLLSVAYDTSALQPETLHEHVEIVSWEGDDILTLWKN